MIPKIYFSIHARVTVPDSPDIILFGGELKRLYAELFQSNQALRESEEKYRLLLEGANEGIVLTQQGRLRYMNPVALRYMGS